MDGDWRADLDAWLELFVAEFGHKAQRSMGPACIAGLIGPADRKSIQPIAARTGVVPYDRLHHFVSVGVWDSAPLEAAL
ncbi:putative transposase [Acetobacter nitrogenifigens DSM 23921 = NBRC 105050]|uniref:transposase n=2 Tax=Acetobacter nitrogenifigens TaxID=285268 RepID=UPI00041AEDC9|nr:putative transposase [Acetobacter nitrogenifigens DSM 23921 = NBRC 105050]